MKETATFGLENADIEFDIEFDMMEDLISSDIIIRRTSETTGITMKVADLLEISSSVCGHLQHLILLKART